MLPDLQTRVLNYIEEHWTSNKAVPTPDKLAEQLQLPEHTVQEFFEDELFQEVLQRKYLWDQYTKPASSLSARQLHCLNLLSNNLDRRTPRQKLKELKVTTQQFNRWLEEPAFAKALNQKVNDNFKANAYRVKQAIVEEAASGDIAAAKFYMELTGEYTPTSKSQVSVSVDINRTVDLLIEVILRHVTPEVAKAIGSEFEMVLNGQKLPSLPVSQVLSVPAVAVSRPPVPVEKSRSAANVVPVESHVTTVMPPVETPRSTQVRDLIDFFTDNDPEE